MKKITYNNPPEIIILLIMSILYIITLKYLIITVIFIGFMLYKTANNRDNKGREYFTLSKSIFCKDKIWVNMSVRKAKKRRSKEEFIAELQSLMDDAPNNAEFYCCTHDKVLNILGERISIIEKIPIYKKDIKGYKKKINNPDTKSEIVQFYAVKFRKTS